MTSFRKRTLLLLCVALAFPMQSVQTAETPLQWTDLSSKLSVRENRPVWAIAYAQPYWYFTDGLDLNTGGHIWRTDGTSVGDITAELRASGLTRADDIVSDGHTVLFLTNIVSGKKNFNALAYTNGKVQNPTSVWRSYLEENESLVSVSGLDGEWLVTTSHGRLFRWNIGTQSFRWVILPNSGTGLTNVSLYSLRHVSPPDAYPFFLAPVSVTLNGSWLIAVPRNKETVQFWSVYKNGSVKNVTDSVGSFSYLRTLASDGRGILVAGKRADGSEQVLRFNGTDTRELSATPYQQDAVQGSATIPADAWSRMRIGINKDSWVLIYDKTLLRFDGVRIQKIGETFDVFLAMAGDGRDRFLAGGLASWFGYNRPFEPLSARLVLARDNGLVNPIFPSDISEPTVTDQNISVWFDSQFSDTDLRRDGSRYIQIHGWAESGLDRIELLSNDTVLKTCSFTSAYDTQSCSMTLYGSEYADGSELDLRARAVALDGATAYSDAIHPIRITNGNIAGQTVTAWFYAKPDTQTLSTYDPLTIEARAFADRGLNRIDVYANDTLVRRCHFVWMTGTHSCDATVDPSDYADRETLNIQVIATDQQNKTDRSVLRTFRLQ